MKFIFAILLVIAFTSCNSKPGSEAKQVNETASTPVSIGEESQLLLKDLEENGDYVNSKDFPSLIKASIVNESLDKNIHIIDIRNAGTYKNGHISGSVNKKFEELPTYFETGIKPFEFEKIILVCDDGQISSYTTALLRLMGYGNVFAMRWGMSAWNEKFAKDGWFKSTKSDFEQNLDKTNHSKPLATGMPDLSTGLSSGAEIAKARFAKVFSEGTDSILISADKVFANPGRFFVINYERKDKYDDGHIPGSVRYKPDATLGIVSEMTTIPADKPVVIYCGTGHNSGFVTAYLRLFGYNARTLAFGNNAFMFNKMNTEKAALSWLPFTKEEVNGFEVVK
jgi:rhodanese-related sulfurtransferase